MAATAQEIADELAVRVATVPGVHAFAYVPDNVTPPTAAVTPVGVTFHNASGDGGVFHEFTIQLVVSRSVERAAQKLLNDFISYSGSRSVRAAVEGDRTLDSTVADVVVDGASNIGVVRQGDAEYLAVDFNVRVHA